MLNLPSLTSLLLLFAVLALTSCATVPRPATKIPDVPLVTEDEKLNFAIANIEDSKFDVAKIYLDLVEDNERKALGIPDATKAPRKNLAVHPVVAEYRAVMERRMKSNESDQLFQSDRFRFHIQNPATPVSEGEEKGWELKYEEALTKVIDWVGETEWNKKYFKTIFVEIKKPPVRDAWELNSSRLDRSPMLEVDGQHPLEGIKGSLAQVVLPHSCLGWSEGLAGLVDPQGGVRTFHAAAQVPVKELLTDCAVDGKRAEFSREDEARLFTWLSKKGKGKLILLFRATAHKTSSEDLLQSVTAQYGPLEELEKEWIAANQK